jgi:hypothetical protein
MSATPQTTQRRRPGRRKDAGELAGGGWRGPPRKSVYLEGVSRQPSRETGRPGAAMSRLGAGVRHGRRQPDAPPRRVQVAALGRQGSLRARGGIGAGGQWGRGAKVAGAAAAGGGRRACPHATATATTLPSRMRARQEEGRAEEQASMHRREGPGGSGRQEEGGSAGYRSMRLCSGHRAG